MLQLLQWRYVYGQLFTKKEKVSALHTKSFQKTLDLYFGQALRDTRKSSSLKKKLHNFK